VWHYVAFTDLAGVAPDLPALLSADELAFYNAAPKARLVVTMRLRQLVASAGLDVAQVAGERAAGCLAFAR
jgi:hypothetical protein